MPQIEGRGSGGPPGFTCSLASSKVVYTSCTTVPGNATLGTHCALEVFSQPYNTGMSKAERTIFQKVLFLL